MYVKILFLIYFLQMSEFVDGKEACLLDNIEKHIKEETIEDFQEDDLLEIVDNLKQEEPTKEDLGFSLFQQSEHTQHVNVLKSAELVKQESEEEDPLLITSDVTETSEDHNIKSAFASKDVQYKCVGCGKSFCHFWRLERHIKDVHVNLRYAVDSQYSEFLSACDKCDKKFFYQTHLKKTCPKCA